MESLQNGADTLFVLLGAIMVLAMHSCFALLEVGTVRHKNQVNALVGLRLDEEQEFQGADLSMHRISASPRD